MKEITVMISATRGMPLPRPIATPLLPLSSLERVLSATVLGNWSADGTSRLSSKLDVWLRAEIAETRKLREFHFAWYCVNATVELAATLGHEFVHLWSSAAHGRSAGVAGRGHDAWSG
jgi:hypothetical protein